MSHLGARRLFENSLSFHFAIQKIEFPYIQRAKGKIKQEKKKNKFDIMINQSE